MLPHAHVHVSRITRVKTPINAPNNVNVIGHQAQLHPQRLFRLCMIISFIIVDVQNTDTKKLIKY